MSFSCIEMFIITKLRDKITAFFRNTQVFSCICQKNIVILQRFANKWSKNLKNTDNETFIIPFARFGSNYSLCY